MFHPGELIIYGNSGVCKVVEISGLTMAGAGQEKLYYKLLPIYGTETIYTPVDTTVFMRPLISRQQAEELIARIPAIQAEIYSNSNLSMLREHYETSIKSHDCQDLLYLIKSVYAKNQHAILNKKKLGQLDQRYMKQAEDLLYGELAAALGIPRDQVVQYIENVVTVKEHMALAQGGRKGEQPWI